MRRLWWIVLGVVVVAGCRGEGSDREVVVRDTVGSRSAPMPAPQTSQPAASPQPISLSEGHKPPVVVPPSGALEIVSPFGADFDAPSALPESAAIQIHDFECQLVAPGWHALSGVAEVPGSVIGTQLELVALGSQGDLAGSASALVVPRSSGRFMFLVETALIGPDQRTNVPRWDRLGSCELSLREPRRQLARVVPAISSEPVIYEPETELTALGVGAVLAGDDPRITYAYAHWFEATYPMTELWLPTSQGLILAELQSHSSLGCRMVVGEVPTLAVGLTQKEDCEGELGLTLFEREPPIELDGWTWYLDPADSVGHGQDLWVVVSQRDAKTLRISGFVPEDIVRLAQSLVLVQTGSEVEPFDRVGADVDLETAIQEIFSSQGFTERTRFPYDEGWMVFTNALTDVDDVGRRVHQVFGFEARLLPSGVWNVTSGPGISRTSSCLEFTSGYGHGLGADMLAVAADPSWPVQQLVDGEWVDRSRAGIAFVFDREATGMFPWPLPFRLDPSVDPSTSDLCTIR